MDDLATGQAYGLTASNLDFQLANLIHRDLRRSPECDEYVYGGSDQGPACTFKLWCFSVPKRAPHRSPYTRRDVKIDELPGYHEKFAQMMEAIEGLSMADQSANAMRKYEALRSDLQRALVHKTLQELELRAHDCWTIAAIDTVLGKRRVKFPETDATVKQIVETKLLYVLMKQNGGYLDSKSIFAELPVYTTEEVDQLFWDVPGAPRKDMRDAGGQCLTCIFKKTRCSYVGDCAECVAQKVPCIRGKIFECNVFDYDAGNSLATTQVLGKRTREDEKSQSSSSLLRFIEHMPRDSGIADPLTQLDLILKQVSDAVYRGFGRYADVPEKWCEAQNFVAGHRGRLHLLLEANFILVYSHCLEKSLGPKQQYIHALRANAGREVLKELKNLCQRDRFAAIKQDPSWSSDMLTYLMFVLKAVLELGDTLHRTETKVMNMRTKVEALQQALCFFIRDLSMSLFGRTSEFATELETLRDGDGVYDRIWKVHSAERLHLAKELGPTRGKGNFYLMNAGSADESIYTSTAKRLVQTLELRESITKKIQPADKDQAIDTFTRSKSIHASLAETFADWYPFRVKTSTARLTSSSSMDHFFNSMGGEPSRPPPGGSKPVPFHYSVGTEVTITKTENSWYSFAGQCGDILRIQHSYLLCNECWRLYSVYEGKVIYDCEQTKCNFSVVWYYYLVHTDGSHFMGETCAKGSVPLGLVPSGRFKPAYGPAYDDFFPTMPIPEPRVEVDFMNPGAWTDSPIPFWANEDGVGEDHWFPAAHSDRVVLPNFMLD